MLSRFRYVLSGNGWRFAGVLVFGALLNGTFSVVDPLVLKLLVDRGLVQRDFGAFLTFAVAVVLLGLLVRVGLFGYELLSQALKNSITESVSSRMLRAFYKLSYTEARRADGGYYLSRIYDEPSKTSQGTVQIWIGLATQGMSLLAAGAVAFYLSWRITLLLSLIVPLLYYVANRFGPKIKEVSKVENEEEAKLRGVLGGAVAAYATVRLFGLDLFVHERTGVQVRRFLDALFSRVRTAKSFDTISKIFLSLAEVVVLLAAGFGVVTGSLTIGGLFGFLNAFWKVIGAANGLIGLLPESAKLNGYIERLMEFESSARVSMDDDGEAGDDRIELLGVDFRYDGRVIFQNLNLRIDAGERVLIVGPNGSGKSTLAYLMTRFLKPDKGVVRAPELRRVSAMLTPFHFAPGSLKDNVDYDRLSPEKRSLFGELVEELGLTDKVEADALSELSAGEAKKAQFIMTLLKDADVYIFDEPLAHVDAESKEAILRRQIERAQGKTLITILHGDEKYHPLFTRVCSLAQTVASSSA